MSYDSEPPGSPLQLVSLDSPPISPVSLNFLASAIDHSPVFYRSPHPSTSNTSTLTPTKRPRKNRTQNPARRKGFRTRTCNKPESQQGTSDWTSEDLFGQNYISSRSPSPPPIQTTVPTEYDEYERYVNLVLADCLPFYQISQTVYVVQGWDRKNNEPTVRASI
jgi:hypothetical protein